MTAPLHDDVPEGIRALSDLGIPLMLVAVHPCDTDGAARAGLGSAWINRCGATYPGYFRSPDLEATSLIDLAAHLR